jgi:flavin-dependent dehydrogenase
MRTDHDVAIIGGGPAGSTAALALARAGFDVCLVEKRSFPREVLCGEFLSSEVIAHLKETGLFEDFLRLSPVPIMAMRAYSDKAIRLEAGLPFRAYALRRGPFDALLLDAAKNAGAKVLQPAEIREIVQDSRGFTLRIAGSKDTLEVSARHLVGAYGKQSFLDKLLKRDFVGERSRLNAVKFHIDAGLLPRLERNAIHLFTFNGLYCGLNAVDGNLITVCWLERRSEQATPVRERLRDLIGSAGIGDVPLEVLGKIPVYGTGNIYFGRRDVIADGIFMIGDAAGMIAPLAGDGIGMAIESARLLSGVLVHQRQAGLDDRSANDLYRREWAQMFQKRRVLAGMVQRILLHTPTREAGFRLARTFPSMLGRVITATRGGVKQMKSGT